MTEKCILIFAFWSEIFLFSVAFSYHILQRKKKKNVKNLELKKERRNDYFLLFIKIPTTNIEQTVTNRPNPGIFLPGIL